MTFHVGQKVVCVDDVLHGRYNKSPTHKLCPLGVVAGEVYTIEKFNPDHDGFPVVWLHGVFRRPVTTSKFDNVPLAAARFRPAQEQGMSILRAIAANPKQKVNA